MSFFDELPDIEEKNSFFNNQYELDTRKNKINASIGLIYSSDDNTKLESYSFMNEIEKRLYDKNLNKEYSTLQGIPDFMTSVFNLFFPDENLNDSKIIVSQSMTGGSALRLGAEIIKNYISECIYTSNETFSLYYNIFKRLEIKTYPYYEYNENHNSNFCFDKTKEYFKNLPNNSVVNLQLSSHNPTGLDPDYNQWEELANIFKEKNHLAFFDCAYLGYGSGSFEEDLTGVRIFQKYGLEFMLAVSTGKPFLNCSNDIGIFFACINDHNSRKNVKNLISVLNRSKFSFPSLHGARIIMEILNDKNVKEKWIQEHSNIFKRVYSIRLRIIDSLEKLNKSNISESKIKFLKEQKGLYMYLDIDNEKVELLKKEYGIYLSNKGRINITSINNSNIEYFVNSIAKVL